MWWNLLKSVYIRTDLLYLAWVEKWNHFWLIQPIDWCMAIQYLQGGKWMTKIFWNGEYLLQTPTSAFYAPVLTQNHSPFFRIMHAFWDNNSLFKIFQHQWHFATEIRPYDTSYLKHWHTAEVDYSIISIKVKWQQKCATFVDTLAMRRDSEL